MVFDMSVNSTFSDNPFARFRLILEREVEKVEEGVKLPSKFKSQRAELFNELYGFYEKSYKKNMWSAYRMWLGKNKLKHSPERIVQFKKSKDFRKPITVRSFCSYWLGFLETGDLYFLLSVAKDKFNRGENFNKWLFWAIKKESVV